MHLNRRQLIRATLLACPGLAFACSDDGDDGSDIGEGTSSSSGSGSGSEGGNGCEDGAAATISENHGHALSIAAQDVDVATEMTYEIQGSAGHSHSVTISAAQFAALMAGESLTVLSTSASAHAHNVTLRCASA